MLNPSLYPVANGVDPLAPEAPKTAVPVPGDAGPSANVAAASPVAAKKRGGILGALESVFMPDPGSRWAGALRDGLFNAKESQQNYQINAAKQATDLATANVKLKSLLTKGEYQIVGNNIFHIKPDGSTELITPPSATDDKVKLITDYVNMAPDDPRREAFKALIFGGEEHTPESIAATNAARIAAAKAHAGATVQAARIRSAPKPATTLPPLPPGFSVVK